MLDAVVLVVLAVGFTRIHGERWEWSRKRLERTLRVWTDGVPALLAQCRVDVRELYDEGLGLLPAGARRKLTGNRLDRFLHDPPAPRGSAAISGNPSGATETSRDARAGDAPPGSTSTGRTLRSLQRRYVEGAISLEQYRREAESLRRPGGLHPA